VSGRVELEHGASVTWVGEVDQGVVSDHSCTRGGVKNRLTRCVRSEGFRGAWARKSSRVAPGSPDRNDPRTLSYRIGAPLTRTRASDVDASRRRKGKVVPRIAPVTTTSSSSSSARFAGPAPRNSLFTTTSTTSSSLLPTATPSSSSESVKSTTSTPAISAAPPRVWVSRSRPHSCSKKLLRGTFGREDDISVLVTFTCLRVRRRTTTANDFLSVSELHDAHVATAHHATQTNNAPELTPESPKHTAVAYLSFFLGRS